MKPNRLVLVLGLLLCAALLLGVDAPLPDAVPKVTPGPAGIEQPIPLERCDVEVLPRPPRHARRVGVVDVQAVKANDVVLDEQALGTACGLLATHAVPEVWYFDVSRKSHVRLVLYSTLDPAKKRARVQQPELLPEAVNRQRRGSF